MSDDPPPERTIRFFADYAGTPLWGPVLGPLEPERIALEAELVARLRAYDAYFARCNPVGPQESWPDDAAADAWAKEGVALALIVAEQIGPGAGVVGADRRTVHHSAEARNPAAAAAFEAIVAEEAAEGSRTAALVARGGRWTVLSEGGEEYRQG